MGDHAELSILDRTGITRCAEQHGVRIPDPLIHRDRIALISHPDAHNQGTTNAVAIVAVNDVEPRKMSLEEIAVGRLKAGDLEPPYIGRNDWNILGQVTG